MKHCPESEVLQDFLDGELDAAREARYRTHLGQCAECAAGLAGYRRVWVALESAPLYDPGPRFTGRVLARVLPSRRRRRRIAAAGAAYATALAATLAALAALFGNPWGRAALEGASGDVSKRMIQFGVFLLNAVEFTVLRMADGWVVMDSLAEKLSPLGHALTTMLAQPAIALTLWAAVAVTAGVLWWMRPRLGGDRKGARHVGILGF